MSHTPECPIGKWQRDVLAWCEMPDGEARDAELRRIAAEAVRLKAVVEEAAAKPPTPEAEAPP
jgi:hypothetical protein